MKYDCQVLDRFPRDMVLARRAVESGAMGRMGFANVDLNLYLPQGYYRQTPFQHRTWRGTWQGEGGGAAFHHGRYIVDPFLSVVGSPAVQVFAYSGPMLRKIEHDSLSQAVVKFANGATGVIHASLITHTSSEMRERTSVGNRGSISVAGYDAAMSVQNENLPRGAEGLPVMTSTTEFTSSDNPAALESLEAMREDVAHLPNRINQERQTRSFLEAIINDSETEVPIEVPRHHVEVTRAIYKSSEENRPVDLPLDRDDPWYRFEGRFAAGQPPPP